MLMIRTKCSRLLTLLTLICALTLSATTEAQQWQQKQRFPSQGRDHPVGFGINDTGYAMVGMVETVAGITFLDDFYRYLPSEDKWESLQNFPGAARGFSIGVAHQGKGYIGFGAKINRTAGEVEPLDDLWEYNPANDKWRQLPDCPGEPRRHPAMEAVNGKIYVGLGDGNSGNLKDWWVLDLETEEWSQIPDMPGAPRHHPYHFSLNGKVYAGMGHGPRFAPGANASGVMDDWYVYSPEDSTWTELQDFPGQARVAGTQFAHGEYGYILSGDGGNHSYMDSGQFWRYKPETDEWKALPAHPGVSLWAPTSFVTNDMVHMVGGLNRKKGERGENVYAFRLADSTKDPTDTTDNPQDPTGAPEVAKLATQVKLYPNPVSRNLQYQLEGHRVDRAMIYSLKGEVVARQGASRGGINVQELSPGIYVLRLQDNHGKWYSKRFMKQ